MLLRRVAVQEEVDGLSEPYQGVAGLGEYLEGGPDETVPREVGVEAHRAREIVAEHDGPLLDAPAEKAAGPVTEDRATGQPVPPREQWRNDQHGERKKTNDLCLAQEVPGRQRPVAVEEREPWVHGHQVAVLVQPLEGVRDEERRDGE